VNDEEETLLPPLTDKPVQKETVESKRTGSVGVNIFMRYIRAGGCGIVGLSCLFTIFAITSATILLANWWLGRWANSERIRYGLTNTTDNCSSINQSLISTMSNEEWFKERDKNKFYFLGLSLLSVGLLFIRTLSYFISCHITARSLHNQMFNALLRAPVFFFDSNPIGQKIFEIKFLIK
jgi:ATP-binding cassette subfamily C (CFTR/MRP) protein 4